MILWFWSKQKTMYNIIKQKLREREKPINVCVVGCGWFGSRVVGELFRTQNMNPKVIITRTTEKAIKAYLENGAKKEEIIEIKNFEDTDDAKYVVSSNLDLIKELKDIDIVFEATGDVFAGAQAAINSINAGINFVTINYEMDATLGLILAKLAKEKGVVYSGSDGDQPGCLARMINEVKAYGLEPKIVGNCKEFFDMYQTPEGVKPFVPKGQDPYKICSFTDGSKQSFELASVGNAFGLYPAKRGMYGLRTKKIDLIKTFDDLIRLDSIEGGCIEYTMGCCEHNQGGPIFVVAKTNDLKVVEDLKYLKKGDGPFYLFFRDHHLCYLEAISSIAEAVLFNTATLAPKGRYVDVIATAKRDISAGQKLDGIGGFDCYGLVEKADIAAKERLAPLGLAEFAIAKKEIRKDQPITSDMVEVSTNIAVMLREEQDKLPFSQGKSESSPKLVYVVRTSRTQSLVE